MLQGIVSGKKAVRSFGRGVGGVLLLSVGILGATILAATAQTSAPGPQLTPGEASKVPASSDHPAGMDQYQVSRGDTLEVSVFDVPELSREYTVSLGGSISMPLLPAAVPVEGMTLREVGEAIAQRLRQSGIISAPDVSVYVKQSPSRIVTIDGAVHTPMTYPVLDHIGLMALISQAGGLADDAAKSAVVTRGPIALKTLALSGEDVSPTVTVDLSKLESGTDQDGNVNLYPGDRVTVQHSGVFYVIGEVNRPGGYTLKTAQEEITVLQALAIAGDVTSVAKKQKAVLIRRGPGVANGREEIALNLQDILKGRARDRRMEADDILYVPASGGKKALRDAATFGMTAGPTVTAGLIVYRR